jgi:hypothetical protein
MDEKNALFYPPPDDRDCLAGKRPSRGAENPGVREDPEKKKEEKGLLPAERRTK